MDDVPLERSELCHERQRFVAAEMMTLDVFKDVEYPSGCGGAARSSFRIEGQRFDLLGGRYCSIQGGIAAQFKLRDRESGAVRTLYATKLTPALAGIAESNSIHGDLAISLWQDDGIFYGLASDTD